MYEIDTRIDLLRYIDAVFMPLARPAAASDVIVNIAGFGTDDWEGDDGVAKGLKRIIAGPQCFNAARNGFKCSACGFELKQEVCEGIGHIGYCPACGSEVLIAPSKSCGDLAEE